MNNIDSKEYSYDVQCALIVGALFFGLSVLFLIASMHPYVFSIIFCIVFGIATCAISWVVFVMKIDYNTVILPNYIFIVTVDIVLFVLIALQPYRLFYLFPGTTPFYVFCIIIMPVLSAVAGLVAAIKRRKIADHLRVNRDRRLKMIYTHTKPFLKLQFLGAGIGCLLALFLISPLMSGFFGVLLSAIVFIIGGLIGYLISGTLGVIVGCVLTVALDISTVYPFFSEIGGNIAGFFQSHVFAVFGVLYAVGLFIFSIIAYVKVGLSYR